MTKIEKCICAALMTALSCVYAETGNIPFEPLKESSGITYADLGKYAVCTDNLRLRTTQSLDSDTIEIMKKGTKVAIMNIGQSFFTDGIESRWCRVISENGDTGWCFGGYLATQDSIYGSGSLSLQWKKNIGAGAAYSPSGKYVAVKNYGIKNRPGSVYVLECNTGKLIREHTVYAYVTTDSIAFSSDDMYVYFSQGKNLYALNIETGQEEDMGTALNDYGEVTSIVPSDDGRYILCGYRTNYHATAIYSLQDYSWMALDSNNFMWPVSYSFSPDNTRVAGCATNPPRVTVWDTSTGAEIWAKKDYHGYVCFSPDASVLYIVNANYILTVDAQTGEEKKKTALNMPSQWYDATTVFTSDRKTAVMGIGGKEEQSLICLFDLVSGTLLQAFDIPVEGFSDIAVNQEGTRVCVCSFTGNIRHNETTQYILNIGKKKVPQNWISSPNKSRVSYSTYLLEHSYSVDLSPWYNVSFDSNGMYHLSSHHFGEVTAPYSIMENTVRIFPLSSKDQTRLDDYANLGMPLDVSGTWKLDMEYKDFFYQGRLVLDGREMISHSDSPAWETYTYEGVECIKYPWRTEKDDRYIYLKSNLTMRSRPDVSAGKVHKPIYVEGGKVEDRTIVYKDSYFTARAKTVKEDTIDGITAPWYLIVEFTHSGDYMDDDPEFVWIFGGYVIEFGSDKLQYYSRREKENLRLNIIQTGGVEFYE